MANFVNLPNTQEYSYFKSQNTTLGVYYSIMSIISIIRIEYNIVKLIYPQQGTPARYATVFADEFMRKPGRYSTLPGIRAANVVAVVEHAVRGHNTSNPVKLCPVRNCETGHAAGGGPRVLGVGGGEGRLLRATGDVQTWQAAWRVYPTSAAAWSVETRIPMSAAGEFVWSFGVVGGGEW